MSKRLSLVQVAELKQMVKNGEKPDDIAKHFNIAISSVHNYKARFKAEGEDIPNVRGQRPNGSVKPVNVAGSKVKGITPGKRSAQLTGEVTTSNQPFNFVVNGISVQISSSAVSVNIDKDKIEIKF